MSSQAVFRGAVLCAATLLFAPQALAQAGDDAPKKDGADASKKDGADGAAKPAEAGAAAVPAGKAETYEDPSKTYRFIGLRFRDVVVPKFMINLFADGGSTVNVAMFGPEYTMRRDHLEYQFSFMYADYSMNPFLFKSKSDGDNAFEIVSSGMKILYLTADLLYEVPLDTDSHFAFLFGGGIGIGFVVGPLYRNQAYPLDRNNADPNDVTKWAKCVAPSNPGVTSTSNGQPYCDGSNPHYGSYQEASWADGGSKPLLFPWISLPQFSFRYKPIKELQTRADLGFSISGFYFGFAASYGL